MTALDTLRQKVEEELRYLEQAGESGAAQRLIAASDRWEKEQQTKTEAEITAREHMRIVSLLREWADRAAGPGVKKSMLDAAQFVEGL